MHLTTTDKKLIFIVLVFFVIVNFMSTGGHTDMWDGMVTFLVAESMATKHSAKLHSDIPSVTKSHVADTVRTMINYEIGNYKAITGKYAEWIHNSMPMEPVYSTRNLLLPAIVIPFYYMATISSISALSVIAFFSNSLIIALTSLVVFCFSLEMYGSRRIAFILSLIFAVCSFILPYNTTLFPQPLQTLLIIAAAFLLYKSLHFDSSFICNYCRIDNNNNNNSGGIRRAVYFSVLAGLFLGFSVFAHPTSVIVIPGFIIYSIFSSIKQNNNKKGLTSFLISLSLVLIFMGIVNYWRFGSFTEFGYGSYYGTLSYHNSWTGLIGLFASPGKGLIFYFPIVILLPLALKYTYKRNRWLFFLIVYIISVHWLYFGTIDDSQSRFWSGAIAWGPRYLVPTLPFLTLAFGALLSRFKQIRTISKISLIILSVAGFSINLLGILVWSEYGTIYGWDREELYKVPAFEVMAWNPYYSPIVLHLKVLMDDYVSKIPVEQYRYSAWHYTTYGLAPCSYDLYIFCKFGLVPILTLSIVNAILALKILNIRIVRTLLLFPIRSKNYCLTYLGNRRRRRRRRRSGSNV